MPIKNLTTTYRPQRQGKIHLGVKKEKQTAKGKVEYPTEVDYFVLGDAPELVPIYGDKPKELHVTLPSALFEKTFELYLEKIFPQYYKRYRASGLYCKGDGQTAVCVNAETGAMEEQPCPCSFLENGECKMVGIFRFRVQEVPTFNVYQISTSSVNSVLNINSFTRDLLEFCLSNLIDVSTVKLVLRRSAQTIQRMEGGKPTKSSHHIMVLDLDPRFYKSLDDVKTKILPGGPTGPPTLPPPDESRDPLLYPKQGFAPKEEEPETQEEPLDLTEEPAAETFSPNDLTKAATILFEIIEEYRKLGGHISPANMDKIMNFKKIEQYNVAIDFYAQRLQEAKAKKK